MQVFLLQSLGESLISICSVYIVCMYIDEEELYRKQVVSPNLCRCSTGAHPEQQGRIKQEGVYLKRQYWNAVVGLAGSRCPYRVKQKVHWDVEL